MVSFNQVPNGIRVPFFAVEFDSTRAAQGPATLNYRGLLIGQRITGQGTTVNDRLYRVTSADQVAALAGRGSQLHRQAIAWYAANKSTELWVGVLADDGAAVAATATLTLTGSPTADGTISLYIGGMLCRVGVTAGQTVTAVAAAIAAAVGATSGSSDYPVKAAAAAGVVTFTANNKGLVGNDLDLRLNYQDTEATPAGLTAVVTAFSAGATNPVLTALIGSMGDTWFHVIAHPYTDATSLTAIETEMASRSGPMRMIDGLAITAKNASQATVSTLGFGRNSAGSTILSATGFPTNPVEIAAHVAGTAALYAQIDPARPLQTLPLPFILAPAEIDKDTIAERDLLLKTGIAVMTTGPGNLVQINRLITTYQRNSLGAPDTSYLNAETVFTLMFLRYTFRTQLQTRYPRAKLANDGTRISTGQAVITPKIGKAEAVSWFRQMEELGLVEGFDQFKADLVVERDASDPNRMNWLLSPDLINQLIVGAAKISFIS